MLQIQIYHFIKSYITIYSRSVLLNKMDPTFYIFQQQILKQVI